MNKIKLLAPLALCAMTLASCNKTTSDIKDITLLDRVSYKSANTFYSLIETFQKIEEAQFLDDENGDYIFQLSPQGTETIQYCIKISGTVKLDQINEMGEITPINFNNWDIAIGNKITFSWDLEKLYLKVANEQESYYFGVEEKTTENPKYYRYHNSEVKGNKYKTQAEYEGSVKCFTNFILTETLLNSSVTNPFRFITTEQNNFNNKISKGRKQKIGFDLSGFLVEENMLSIGAALANENIPTKIDEFLAINPFDELTAKCASNDEKTASVELKLDETDLEQYSSLLELYLGVKAAGKMGLDYFAAFADSRIKQQELLLDVKNASLLGFINTEIPFYNNRYDYDNGYIVNANNLNITLHVNEEVTDKCEVVDEYDPTSYIEA